MHISREHEKGLGHGIIGRVKGDGTIQNGDGID
jgi:hypothetical protein